jgi:predicted amidophosphoribosyltransferase
MGECIGAALLKDNEKLINSYDAGNVILIPIPLHRGSKRRFNQSCAIARGISRVLGFQVSESLSWSFDVKAQTEKSGKERLELAENVFTADKITGKNVIIVDDVFTTGTTLKRALSACIRAGAERGGAIVWAKP